MGEDKRDWRKGEEGHIFYNMWFGYLMFLFKSEILSGFLILLKKITILFR